MSLIGFHIAVWGNQIKIFRFYHYFVWIMYVIFSNNNVLEATLVKIGVWPNWRLQPLHTAEPRARWSNEKYVNWTFIRRVLRVVEEPVVTRTSPKDGKSTSLQAILSAVTGFHEVLQLPHWFMGRVYVSYVRTRHSTAVPRGVLSVMPLRLRPCLRLTLWENTALIKICGDSGVSLSTRES